MIKNYLFVVCIIATILGFAEVLSRSYLWRAESPLNIGSVNLHASKSTAGDWNPNQDGTLVQRYHFPYYIHTNDQGFRNLENINKTSHKILALGDSITFGLYVSSQDIWTNVAEKQLNARSQTKFQILNNGLPGGTIYDYHQYLLEKGMLLKPDIVLLALNKSDVDGLARGETSVGFVRDAEYLNAEKNYGSVLSSVRWFLGNNSGAYGLARKIKNNIILDSAVQELKQKNIVPNLPKNRKLFNKKSFASNNRVNNSGGKYLNQFKDYLAKTILIARKIGSNVVVVLIPSSDHATSRQAYLDFRLSIKKITDKFSVPMMDVLDEFAKHKTHYLYFSAPNEMDDKYIGDSHLTRMGNILAGEKIASFLKQNLNVKP